MNNNHRLSIYSGVHWFNNKRSVHWRGWMMLCLFHASYISQAQIVTPIDTIQARQIRMQVINQEDGLAQGMVSSVVEDSRGYIWMGTKDGLHRYDGRKFKVYRGNPQDPYALPDGHITQLHVDPKGWLWVAVQSAGLFLFDPTTERFIPITNGAHSKHPVTTSIQQILDGPNGSLICGWVTSPRQTYIKETTDTTAAGDPLFEVQPFESIYPFIADAIKRDELKWLCTSDGTIWIRHIDTMYRITPDAFRNRSKPEIYPIPGCDLTMGSSWRKLISNPAGTELYVNSDTYTLLRFDTNQKRFVKHLNLIGPFTVKGNLYGNLYIDRYDRLWIHPYDGTIHRISLQTGETTLLKPSDPAIAEFIKRYGPFSVLHDTHENLWLGTNGGGVVKINTQSERFSFKQDMERKPLGTMMRFMVPNNPALYSTDLVNLLANLDVHRILKETSNLDWNPRLHTPIFDRDGYLWYPALDKSNLTARLIKINPANSNIEILDPYNRPKTGHDNTPYPIFSDTEDHIWYAPNQMSDTFGLVQMNIRTNQAITYTCPIQSIGFSRDYRFISERAQDPAGTNWFATTAGVFSLDPESGVWQQFNNDPDDPTSLSYDRTFCILPDPREPLKTIWVGTDGHGLEKLDLQTGTFTHYTTDNGLPNNVVYAIQSDLQDNLWISTNNGLSLFDPFTEQFRNFDKEHGLPFLEFNRYDFSKRADGTLFFAGPAGMVSFNPKDFYLNTQPSNIVVNQLRINNKPIDYKYNDSINDTDTYTLSAPMEYTKSLTFSHDVRMITLGFSLLDLTTPNSTLFKYKLEGFDQDWIYAGNANEATYTNLSPGHYTFKVHGMNSRHTWTEEPATIEIVIRPPWWGTWWFRISALVLIVALVYALYRYRVAQLLRVERVRNRIAQDLHDEIGSTLSSISLYSAVMQKISGDLPAKSKAILNKIMDSTSQMMESMNDMVWTIKTDNDNFEKVINRMRAFGNHITETKAIHLDFNADKQAEKLNLTMVVRKNLYLIYKEAVNNAVKYSGSSNLLVDLKRRAGSLELMIRDFGKGFNVEEAMTKPDLLGGNGLRSMMLRAKEIGADLDIDSIRGEGTTILISLKV